MLRWSTRPCRSSLYTPINQSFIQSIITFNHYYIMRNAFAKRVVALSQCAADTGAGIVGCLRCKQGISIRKVVSAWKFFLVSFKHRMLVFSDLVPPFPFAEQINEKSINQKTAWCLNYVNVAIASTCMRVVAHFYALLHLIFNIFLVKPPTGKLRDALMPGIHKIVSPAVRSHFSLFSATER